MRRAPAFWWRPDRTPLAHALVPAAALVDLVAGRRMARAPGTRVPVPVICVGNPTVGGAGKTPVAIAIAERLIDRERRPVFLTRGYGGRASGPILVDAQPASVVGDEARLLAAVAPTIVAKRRDRGGALAATRGDVVVMDDGFQNPQLAKDLNFLVIDRAVGLGNGAVTPAGPLRTALARQLAHADAVVLTDAGEGVCAGLPAWGSLPVFTVPLVAAAEPPIAGVRVVVFAGIGRPERVFSSVAALGAEIVSRHAFADHQPLSDRDVDRLVRDADRWGAKLVTTAKDFARLDDRRASHRALRARLQVVTVRAELPTEMDAILARAIGAHEHPHGSTWRAVDPAAPVR